MPLTTSGVETEQDYSQRKDKGEVNKKRKHKQEKKEASYKKQKEASDKVNKQTDKLSIQRQNLQCFQSVLGPCARTA